MHLAEKSCIDAWIPFRESSAEWDRAEQRFFAAIRMRNGVWKTTASHRLDDVNQKLAEVMRRLSFEPGRVLDVGISSGISTMEWLEALRRTGFHPRMTGTDLTMTAYVLRLRSWWHVLVDRDGHPLQYAIAGIALRPWTPRRYYLLGYALLSGLCNVIYRRLAERLEVGSRLKGLRGASPAPGDSIIRAEVVLVTRRLKECSDISLLEDDIMQATPACLRGKFDVVRAANILNREYFSLSEIQRGLYHLRERLSGPGAFLVVVRSEDENSGKNHGSILRLDDTGTFSVVERIGRGAEIEDVALAL